MGEQHRIRTERFCLTLLPEENELLKKAASEFALSRTEYLRRLIVYGGIKGTPLLSREDTDQIIQALVQIGNEIGGIEDQLRGFLSRSGSRKQIHQVVKHSISSLTEEIQNDAAGNDGSNLSGNIRTS